MLEEHEKSLATQAKRKMSVSGRADEGKDAAVRHGCIPGVLLKGLSQVDLCSHNELAYSSVALKQKGGK